MKRSGCTSLSAFLLAVSAALAPAAAHAQAAATATAGLQIAVFGGASGVYTGVALGRNLSLTAGVDATFRPFFGISPALEVRGTYPVHSGSVDGQENLLAGLKLAKHLRRFEPYGDFLGGRGEIRFNPPFPDPLDTVLYEQTASTVLAGGGGCDIGFNDRFSLKADFQFQRYQSPVTPSGYVYAKAFTVGVVYRLPFGGLGHGYR